MKRTHTILSLIAATAVVALTAPSTTLAADEMQEHKELPAASGGTLTLKAVVGAIEIKTHDADTVIFDSVLKPGGWSLFGSGDNTDRIEFDYDTSGGDVKINVRWKDDEQPRNSNLNARHTLVIPSKYNVDVKTAGGSIVAEDINGRVAAGTSGGRIQLGKVNGEVKAHTSGGGISLEDVKGDAEVGTSGGSIKLGHVDGSVIAKTSGGSIQVEAVTGRLKASTSGGSITAELVESTEQPLELSTSGGSIRLTVPGDFKADLNASTSGGGVDCELPLEGTVKRNSVNGRVNGGGPKVSLRTSGGNIKLAKR